MYFHRLGILGVILGVMLAGCSGSGGGAGGGSQFSDAKWAAVLQPSSFGASLIQLGMNFTQTGETISSDSKNSALGVSGCTLDVNSISSTGTVKDGAFQLTFSIGDESITLLGTVAADGQGVTGTFSSSGGACLNGESGTFTASRVSPVTGGYGGTLTDTLVMGGTPATLDAQLTEDADFNESATIKVTGNSCFSSLTTAADSQGASVGGFTYFEASDGTNVVAFMGTVNSTASRISGAWFVITGCTEESGIFQMNFSILAATSSDANASNSGRSAISPALVSRMRAILAERRAAAQTQ